MSLPIPEISPHLLDLEERPQFEIPAFPWEELERCFAQRFPGKKVVLKHESKGWFSGEPWISSFKDREIFPIYVQPVEVPLLWSMEKEDLVNVLQGLINKEELSIYLLEDSIFEAFTYFFAAEILKLVSQLRFSEYLSYHIGEDRSLGLTYLKKEPFFLINVTLIVDHKSILGTLIIPESFRVRWKKYFLEKYGAQFSPKLQKNLDLHFSIDIGYVDLRWEDMKGLSKGDWIVLDHCSYHPASHEGFAVLTIGGQPLFRARLKKNELKVLEYPYVNQGEVIMDKDDEFEEFHFDENPEEESTFYDEVEPLEEEKLQDERKNEKELLSPDESSLMSKIPIRLMVQMATLTMSLEELGKLQAGSLFELPIAYEEGVQLVVNGKKIGRGELVKIGEKMGVRILEL